jgi:hypothetical protein
MIIHFSFSLSFFSARATERALKLGIDVNEGASNYVEGKTKQKTLKEVIILNKK